MPPLIADECVKWCATKNDQDITEEAAIGVMALLLHDLETAEIVRVLPIGSGGDYLVAVRGVPPLQAESSGIRRDPHGYASTSRIKEKTAQVLRNSASGFASVVAFSHPPSDGVHCKLHYVTRPDPEQRE